MRRRTPDLREALAELGVEPPALQGTLNECTARLDAWKAGELKERRRQLARELHPDKHHDATAEQRAELEARLGRVNAAYDAVVEHLQVVRRGRPARQGLAPNWRPIQRTATSATTASTGVHSYEVWIDGVRVL